jgi:hypothetical protein
VLDGARTFVPAAKQSTRLPNDENDARDHVFVARFRSPAPTTTAPELKNVGELGRVCARNGKASRFILPLPAGSITVIPRFVAMAIASCV